MKPTFELLPPIEPKPKEQIHLRPENMVRVLDKFSIDGWIVELKHFPRSGWECSIQWPYSSPHPINAVTAHASCVSNAKGGELKPFKNSFDALDAAIREWIPKWKRYCQENPDKPEEAQKPALALVAKPISKPRKRRKKITPLRDRLRDLEEGGEKR